MQNYSNSNKLMKFPHFTKQLFNSVHTKSFVNHTNAFVNFMRNMNVIQRRKRTHLVHPGAKF